MTLYLNLESNLHEDDYAFNVLAIMLMTLCCFNYFFRRNYYYRLQFLLISIYFIFTLECHVSVVETKEKHGMRQLPISASPESRLRYIFKCKFRGKRAVVRSVVSRRSVFSEEPIQE